MLLWHLAALRHPLQRTTPFDLGGFAVELFFWLSGFLITRNLIHGRANGLTVRGFIHRRVARLMPCYLVYVALIVGIHGWVPDVPWALVYLSNIYYSTIETAIPLNHFWSLAVEEQFYVVWPLVWLLLPPRWGPRVAWLTLPVSVLFAVALARYWAVPDVARAVYRATPVCAFALGGGALVATHERRLRGSRALALLACAVLLGALLVWYRAPTSLRPIATTYVMQLAAGGVFLAVLAGLGRSTLASAPLRWLGLISYSAYVWHALIYASTGADQQGGLALAAGALLAAIAAAALSYRVIERPAKASILGVTRRPLEPPLPS